MTNKDLNEIKMCYWNNKPDKALEAAERISVGIDFDDDDDMEALIELLTDAVADHKDLDMLRFWISKGFDINFPLLKKERLLLKCADRCVDPEIFAGLVAAGADPYAENSDGDNVLLLSAKRKFERFFGDTDPSQPLPVYIAEHYDLERLDKTDKLGITPLLYAVEKNKPELVRALVENGADVNGAGTTPNGNYGIWTEYNGVTPLAVACREGLTEIFAYLLSKGADETATDAKGRPVIFHICKYPFRFLETRSYNSPLFDRKCEIIKQIKNLNAVNAAGDTLLIDSLRRRETVYVNVPITKALIEAGADVNRTSDNGRCALHYAAEFRQLDTIKTLIEKGAQIDIRDKDGNTPLYFAADSGDEKIVRYLLRKGADCKIQNNKGITPMDRAVERGMNDVIDMML